MSTATLNEYLNTSYEPDMEFVEGTLVERNVGTQLHSLFMSIVAIRLWENRQSYPVKVFMSPRLLVDALTCRYRVPDILVLNMPYKKAKVVLDVPAIVVEITSPDDTFDSVVDKYFEYERLGVPNILVMDPNKKRACFSVNKLSTFSMACRSN
jgi:Uma2 family endonuclease